MDIARLRYMANQIARNLAVRGHSGAVFAAADHIATFWDPRMKEAIIADDRSELSEIARDAIDLLSHGKVQPHQTLATEFNSAGETGHSDAG